MGRLAEHVVSVDGSEYVPRLYAIAENIQGGQICPKCGARKSYVYDCRLDKQYKGIFRRRRCAHCGFTWKTLEIMYPVYERGNGDE